MGGNLGRDRWGGEFWLWLGLVVVIEANVGKAPEGPHIYYKDGFYYLLVAEGTSRDPLTLCRLAYSRANKG